MKKAQKKAPRRSRRRGAAIREEAPRSTKNIARGGKKSKTKNGRKLELERRRRAEERAKRSRAARLGAERKKRRESARKARLEQERRRRAEERAKRARIARERERKKRERRERERKRERERERERKRERERERKREREREFESIEIGREDEIEESSRPELDEEELEELAELWGVEIQDVEALYSVVDSGNWANPFSEAWDYERLKDYLDDLAEAIDVEIGELWDLWYYIMYGEGRESD